MEAHSEMGNGPREACSQQSILAYNFQYRVIPVRSMPFLFLDSIEAKIMLSAMIPATFFSLCSLPYENSL